MLQTISQRTQSGASNWIRVGVTSLVLGLGALFMSAGSAFATSDHPIMHMDTVYYADMDVIDLFGRNNTNGNDDQHYWRFDLTTLDFTGYRITGFTLDVKVSQVTGGLSTDNLHLGSGWDGNVFTNDMYIADLFNTSKKANFGQSEPAAGDTFTLNVRTFLNSQQIKGKINGGDVGYIALRLADDFSPEYAKLTLTAVQNPEPASLILMGTGLIGLAAWRIRKQTKA